MKINTTIIEFVDSILPYPFVGIGCSFFFHGIEYRFILFDLVSRVNDYTQTETRLCTNGDEKNDSLIDRIFTTTKKDLKLLLLLL